MLLWFVFFFVGLFPDLAFTGLRYLAGVVTINAYVNNPDVIVIAFTLYLAVFTFLRAREGGLNDAQAQGRAVQVGIVAIIAFLWQPLGLLAIAGDMMHSGWFQARMLVLLVIVLAFMKLVAWFYLLSLIVRYYGFDKRRVFADMVCVFPSAWGYPDAPKEPKAEDWEPEPRKESSE
jgi:hypothetical protein